MLIQFKDENMGFSGVKISGNQEEQKAGKAGRQNSGAIFVGNANQPEDRIEQRKKQAQKEAMKIINDVYAGELKVSNDMDELKQNIERARDSGFEAQKSIDELDYKKEELRESMGIDPESQEQKDLELLVKGKEADRVGSDVTLTDDESKRIKEIRAGSLTEYQERAISLEEHKDPHLEQIMNSEQIITSSVAVINEVKLERLKSDPMKKAQNEAEIIRDEASQDIIGMLVTDAKDHIDKEIKENTEAAEKKKEAEAEQDKLIEEAKKDKLETEKQTVGSKDTETAGDIQADLTEVLVSGDSAQGDIERKLREIEEKLKLLSEDLKGAAVDAYS